MSISYRPKTYADRDQILRSTDSYMASADADPTLKALYERIFAGAASTYRAARDTFLGAQAAWQSANATADAADQAFDAALRKLMLSFRDEEGSVDRALNQSLLGMQPNELMALRYAEEVTAGRSFLTRLANRPELSANPERLARFTEALDALEVAASAQEKALRVRLGAGAAQDAARLDFDATWGKFARTVQAAADEATAEAIIPRFYRGNESEPTDDEPTGG